MKKTILISLLLLLSLTNRCFADTFQLNLKNGLNYISIPIGSSYNIRDILNQVPATTKQAAFWSPDTNRYLMYANDPAFDQFSTFEYARGYWICLSGASNTALTLTGTTPADYIVNLKKGWNAIGCPKNRELPVEQALLPLKLGTDYTSVWRYSGAAYPYQQYSASAKEFTTLKPGEGYWIRMSKDTAWDISLNPSLAIISIAPADGFTFLSGAQIVIKIDTFSVDGTSLQYQFSLGGAIKQPWSNSNTYVWNVSNSDVGSINVTCEVKDNKGAKDSKILTYRVINPTVQEILQKVVDNYAKIQDFKADMTLSSVLNGQPFGTTEYCRYYFKAPNKEKTETYSESSRNNKIDIIIIDGSDMHLIDPISNLKQQVDLLNDAGINDTQFNQANIYYNQNLFISQHTIVKNNSSSDLNSMIVTLDVLPKSTNNLYDKLGIAIDYSKGIVVGYSIYRKNVSSQLELVQETRTIESQKMPNSAWLPVKMTKIPKLTSGNLVSTLIYSNVQINSGLTDLDFVPTKQ